MGLGNRGWRVGTDTQNRPSVYALVKFTPLSYHKIHHLFLLSIISMNYFNLKAFVAKINKQFFATYGRGSEALHCIHISNNGYTTKTFFIMKQGDLFQQIFFAFSDRPRISWQLNEHFH